MSGISEGILIGNMFADRNAISEANKSAQEWKDVAISNGDLYEKANEYVIDLIKTLAGNRTIVRELMEELKKADPTNPLLTKPIRDAIFNFGYERQNNLMPGTTYSNLSERLPKFRDLAFGVDGAKKGGPEVDQVTPNLELRAAINLPSHTTEREKLLAIINKLAVEVKRNNPAADVLKEFGL